MTSKVLLKVIFCTIGLHSTAEATSLVQNWLWEDMKVDGTCTLISYQNTDQYPGCLQEPPYVPFSCSILAGFNFGTFSSTDRPEDAIDCTIPGPNACYDANTSANRLYFHGEDKWNNDSSWEGYALISSTMLDKSQYLSIETDVSAYCGPNSTTAGCFFGLTLYNGETNYRAIAYEKKGGSQNISIKKYAPRLCYDEPILKTISQGTNHKLRLDYFGHEGGK
ncbi:MAG TPA: hypothetical protein VNN09_03710 [Candidatus Competibacteraceae bacterium]|nr:hypothetical protein [Candidatus Competibacteraceae bacterium]